MRWFCSLILVVLLSSCANHTDDVENAIKDLEWIDKQLDEIGERNIPGYKTSIYVPGIDDDEDDDEDDDDEHNDSITLSEGEFRNIQTNLHWVIKDLENLLMKMEKETETEAD